MKKIKAISFLILVIIFMSACSNKITSPVERLAAYIELWETEQWEKMYTEYVDETTKSQYGKKLYIDRVKEIYEQLAIHDVDITFDPSQAEENPQQGEQARIPLTIRMASVAGEINFSKEAILIYEAQETGEDWFVQWDFSYLLPELSTEDQLNIFTIQPTRGEIFDRNEKPLAVNGSGAEVGVVAGSFNLENNGQALANVLNVSKQYIETQLNQTWVEEGHFVPLKKIPFTLQSKYEEALLIPGVSAVKTELREYPYIESLAHLIGYTGKINEDELETLKEEGYREEDLIGKRGLEQLLEGRLRGEAGLQITIKKPHEEERRVIAERPAIAGENIILTIDAELQKLIFDEMGDNRGIAAVIHPKTGETLALVSKPAFDPNEFAVGISSSRYESFVNDPEEPLLNRFSGGYIPGSTIKPITAAIGLKEGSIHPDDDQVIEGLTWQKDESWGDYQVTRVSATPNPVTLEKALVYSDNIYFAKEALKMKGAFLKGLEQFAFGEQTPFKYGLRKSQVSNDGNFNSEGQFADTSFGQGEMLVNIIHLASMYGAIVNEGTMMKPILFQEEQKAEVWKEHLMSVEHAQLLKKYLRAVVTDGFLEDVNHSSVKISGKTGTAELKSTYDDERRENGFFVAYPTEKEDYIIAMMIERVEDKGGSNYVAAKVANIMEMIQ